jgi:hypothetical protein
MISPPIIGAVSDATGSLRTGLQVTWVAVLVSGAAWAAGASFLPPLPDLRRNQQVRRRHSRSNRHTSSRVGASDVDGGESGCDGDSHDRDNDASDESPLPTFWALLCGREPDDESGYEGPQAGTALLEATANPLASGEGGASWAGGRGDLSACEAGSISDSSNSSDSSSSATDSNTSGSVRDSRNGERPFSHGERFETPLRPRRRQGEGQTGGSMSHSILIGASGAPTRGGAEHLDLVFLQ